MKINMIQCTRKNDCQRRLTVFEKSFILKPEIELN